MGACCVCQQQTPMMRHSSQISRELRQDKRIETQKKKLLILGPKYSGKSTIFNQLKYLHGNGFDHVDRTQSKIQINYFIIHSMQQIIACAQQYETYKQYPIHKFTLNKESQISAQFISDITLNTQILMNHQISNHLKILRQQNCIKTIVNNASKYYIDVSFEYFFDNFDRICNRNYIPSDQDIIKLRLKSDGFNETLIEVRSVQMTMYDLNYKPDICNMNKYMHCFECVTAIIFVSSLCCFDEPVFDDDTSYRQKLEWEKSLEIMGSIVGNDILNVIMSFTGYPRNSFKESLTVFDNLCNSTWFHETAVLLFLSKTDLFAQKIAECAEQCNDTNAFTDCFQDYKGNYDYYECCQYISKKFHNMNHSIGREVFTHFVNSTDSTLMNKVFNDTQHIIINASLSQGGLIA